MQKMRRGRVLALVLAVCMLGGCEPVEPVDTGTATISQPPGPTQSATTSPGDTPTAPPTAEPTTTPQQSDRDLEALYKSAEQKVMPHIQAALVKLEEAPRDDLSAQSFPPEEKEMAYEGLDDEQKQLYDEMYPKIRALEYFEYTAEEYGYDTLDNVLIAWGALQEDYLEFNNFFMVFDKLEGDTTVSLYSLYFHPYDEENKPAKDMAKLQDELDEFEFACNIIVENMPQQGSAFDKYRYLAYVISYSTSYDYSLMGGTQLSNSYGGVLGGKSICQGYSETMQYLCDRAGLWCQIVEGSSRDESHGWNMVMLEDGSYHVDITWSDESEEPGDEGWMRYFMLTQQQILTDHDISSGSEATGTVEYVEL